MPSSIWLGEMRLTRSMCKLNAPLLFSFTSQPFRARGSRVAFPVEAKMGKKDEHQERTHVETGKLCSQGRLKLKCRGFWRVAEIEKRHAKRMLVHFGSLGKLRNPNRLSPQLIGAGAHWNGSIANN